MCENISVIENPDDNLKYLKPFSPSNRRILHVVWTESNSSVFTCTIIPSHYSEPIIQGEKHGLDRDEIINKVSKDLGRFFHEVIKLLSPQPDDWESFLTVLRSQSKNLFRNIIPDNIAFELNQWEEGSWVEVLTNENWIPWELLHDENGFWGERFVLTRRICHESRVGGEKPIRPAESVLNVIGGDLKTGSTGAKSLFDDLPSSLSVVHLEEKPVSVLLKCLTDQSVDIIHFTCHGLSDPMRLRVDKKDLSATSLSIETVVEELSLKIGSLVFANACNSASTVKLFNENLNFGSAFCQQGANVFIGTLGPIPTKYAIDFARDIYTELFLSGEDENDRSIGYAMAIAKKKALDKKNLFWLLYCMYGNSNYCIQQSSA